MPLRSITGRPTVLPRMAVNIASDTMLPSIRPEPPPKVQGGGPGGGAPGAGGARRRIASEQSLFVRFRPAPSRRSARAVVRA